MNSVLQWRTARYRDWNAALVDYFFPVGAGSASVERIPAGAEELQSIIGDDAIDSTEVVQAFVTAVRAELPQGRSFCGFCLDQQAWRPDSPEPPHFFGMLWFTCLLASGYPDDSGDFFARFRGLIGTSDNLRTGRQQRDCLNQLWEDFEKWTTNSPTRPSLVLPPRDDRLKVVGRSYFLAFPQRRDRKALFEALASDDLVGFEPPIIPVVDALERGRDRFSSEFRSELDHFIGSFLGGGRDPYDSAFWRAVRSVALSGVEFEVSPSTYRPEATLLASWDDDETLLVKVVVKDPTEFPEFRSRPLANPVDGFTHSLVDAQENNDAIAEQCLTRKLDLSHGISMATAQGIVLFRRAIAGEYIHTTGERIGECDVALIREDRLGPFRGAFRGVAEDSRFGGWWEVTDCAIRQVAELPNGLEGARQLLYTSTSTRPRLIEGVEVGGGYLWMPELGPFVRCPGAESVEIIAAGERRPCRESATDARWIIPPELDLSLPAIVEIRAVVPLELRGRVVRREVSTSCRFVEFNHGLEFKSAPAGGYWRESCVPEQREHAGRADVPLDITTDDASNSADLLMTDPSIRYLGPGLGEMDSTRHPGFDWMVVGPKKRPRDVIFIGDLDSPTLPDGGESSDKGDQRAWSSSFTSAHRVHAKLGDKYLAPLEEPRLVSALKPYQRRARRQLEVGEKRPCGPSNIDAWLKDAVASQPDSDTCAATVEAISALAVSRSGLPLKQLQPMMMRLIGQDDHLFCNQLIRAWTEAGAFDVLRRQDRSQTVIVPRRPRFVMVRRGPTVDATLIGLCPRSLSNALHSMVKGRIEAIPATTRFQPSVPRFVEATSTEVATLSTAVGIAPPEWLLWPDSHAAPTVLDVDRGFQGFKHGPPPQEYVIDAKWDWERMTFRNARFASSPSTELVEVERRRHPDRCSIYVVVVDGEAMAWCYVQAWALLRAAELRGSRPFRYSQDGYVRSAGAYPMHLPLPFGRICAVLGAGLPGPELTMHGVPTVQGYRYPFGRRVQQLVRALIPASWVDSGSQER